MSSIDRRSLLLGTLLAPFVPAAAREVERLRVLAALRAALDACERGIAICRDMSWDIDLRRVRVPEHYSDSIRIERRRA